MVLQEAIRQREESTLTNDIDIRSRCTHSFKLDFNESEAMSNLKQFEEDKRMDLEDLEVC